jgi:hypothetical protein
MYPCQVEDNVWSAPLFFRVGGLAEGFPGGGGVVETALLLVSDDVGDVWTKDQARPCLAELHEPAVELLWCSSRTFSRWCVWLSDQV